MRFGLFLYRNYLSFGHLTQIGDRVRQRHTTRFFLLFVISVTQFFRPYCIVHFLFVCTKLSLSTPDVLDSL